MMSVALRDRLARWPRRPTPSLARPARSGRLLTACSDWWPSAWPVSGAGRRLAPEALYWWPPCWSGCGPPPGWPCTGGASGSAARYLGAAIGGVALLAGASDHRSRWWPTWCCGWRWPCCRPWHSTCCCRFRAGAGSLARRRPGGRRRLRRRRRRRAALMVDRDDVAVLPAVRSVARGAGRRAVLSPTPRTARPAPSTAAACSGSAGPWPCAPRSCWWRRPSTCSPVAGAGRADRLGRRPVWCRWPSSPAPSAAW